MSKPCSTHPTTRALLLFLVAIAHLLTTAVCMILLVKYVMPLDSQTVVLSSSYFHFFMGILTYILLRFVTIAPFGRHAGATTVHLTLPASLAWALQECPTLLNVLYYIAVEYPSRVLNCSSGDWIRRVVYSPHGDAIPRISEAITTLHVGIFLFVIHYIHRSLFYPLLVRQSTPVPLHITVSATLYCLFNGRLQLLANVRSPAITPSFFESFWWTLLFVLGIIVFCTGMAFNIHSDYHLLSLKKRPPRCVYKIPHGGMFEYVSCANFLGEIVEWCGYTFVVWSTTATTRGPEAGLAACSFAVYVVANLLPRAHAHHAWYLKQFGQAYKKLQRKALIPYVC